MTQRSIEDFKAYLNQGGVRPNQFEVLFTFPLEIRNKFRIDDSDQRQITLLCKATSIPAATTTNVNVGLPGGMALKLPGSRIFDNWTATFINDGNLNIRDLFELWSERVISHGSALQANNLNDILGAADVIQLDRMGYGVRRYALNHLYPVSIEASELGYEQNDSISETTVTFAYHYGEFENLR